MSLPQPDPSNPALPAPLFADVDAVRGDHMRANNQLIWENLQYLFDFTGRTTDTLTEGATNLYYTDVRAKAAALAAALTGFVSGSDAAIAATDTILQAFAKTQGQITALKAGVVKYAKLSHTESSGVAGGNATTGSWETRTLNTEDNDSGNIVSLSGNRFTLAAGTYRTRVLASANTVTNHKARLQNITDATTTLVSLSEYPTSNASTYRVSTNAEIVGEFTIAEAKDFEIQSRVGASQTAGYGLAAGFGVNEVYVVVELWKIG